ncbi:AI-2E family transporter [Candidatus Parcubacteria bacterium]|nr:AI-2E family transporter [Candidatus Parcubacteria bacterium]
MHAEQTISISTATFLKAVFIILGLWFLWYIREIVAIFVIAIMLASVIDPLADWLGQRRIPRGLSVLIVYTFLLATASVIVVVLIPILIQQSGALIANLSANSANLVESFVQFKERHQFLENLTSGLASFQESLTASASSVFTTVKGFFGTLAALIIVLVLSFFMVVEEDSMRRYFKTLAPEEYQPYLNQLLKKMQDRIGAWLRGQLILGLVVGFAVYIGLKLLGVPYALLLALMAGLFEIVPYVGPVLSLVPAAIIGFAQSVVLGLAVVVLYLLVQQIENNVLVPKIMQKVTGLNPILSIAALLVGVKVGGVVGAILAIPLATMLAVIVEDTFKEIV